MFLEVLIISFILLALLLIASCVKTLFKPGAEFKFHSCDLKKDSPEKEVTGSKCQLKNLADCPKTRDKQV